MLLKFFRLKTQSDFYKKYGKLHPDFSILNFIGPYQNMKGGITPLGQSNTINVGDIEKECITAQFNKMLLKKLGIELKYAQECGFIPNDEEVFSSFPFLIESGKKIENWTDFSVNLELKWKNVLNDWHSGIIKIENPLYDVHLLNEVSKSLFERGYTKGKLLAILIDDVHRLSRKQQIILNNLLEVSQKPLCFKIGTLPHLWDRNTPSGILIPPDDFELCEIDRMIDEYTDFIRNLCSKRVKSAEIDIDIEEEILGIETVPDKIEVEGYIEKVLGNVDVKREEKFMIKIKDRKKEELEYYGFETAVRLSSGVVRSFVDLTSKIIEEAIKEGWKLSQGIINYKLQDKVIKDESKKFRERARADMNFPDIMRLINYLGHLFHQRFWRKKKEEWTVVRIEINNYNKINPEILKLFNKAIAYGLIQEEKKTKTRKSTYPNFEVDTKVYLLNKMLTPEFMIPPQDWQTVRRNYEDINNALIRGNYRLELFGHPPPEHFDEPINIERVQTIFSKLTALPEGKEQHRSIDLQNYVRELFLYIFNEDLNVLTTGEITSSNGTQRLDILLVNDGRVDPFWKDMKKTHKSNFVVIDTKNSSKPDSRDLDVVGNYLNESRGFLAIVSIRGSGGIPNYLLKKTWRIYRDSSKGQKKVILLINDEDIADMFSKKYKGIPTPSDILYTRYHYFMAKF